MAEERSREHSRGERGDRMTNKTHGRDRRHMAEKRSVEDDRPKTVSDKDSEDTHQPMWNPSAPYLKWKVFVRGKDFTLQGSGACGEEDDDGEEDHSAPAHGEAAKSFYESVVRQGTIQGHTSADIHWERDTEIHSHTRERNRHRNTDTHRDTEIHSHTRERDRHRNTDAHREGDTEIHSHTRERDRHRNTDLTRDRHTDTDREGDTERRSHTHKSRERITRKTELVHGQTNTHTQDSTSTQNPTQTHTASPQQVHTAFRLAQNGDTAGLSAMLDDGLNINTRDGYGWSLLMVAACAGAGNTVRTLLDRGARTGYRDARGNTALYLATIRGHREVTEMLIKANKPMKKRTKRQTRYSSADSSLSGKEEEEEEEEYFCDTCEMAVKERERVTHTASIVHQFKTTTRQTHTQYGIPPSNRGYQLLVGQGWDAEGGLGSEQQGHKFPVKTVLKRDRKGLGAGREMAKVTHFGPGDAGAVRRGRVDVSRVERIATVSRREAKQKKVKEKEEEVRLRRMLNEPDF